MWFNYDKGLIRFVERLPNDDGKELNISVGISAAIAAYSRIEINKYKNLANNKCYYSDTDSVVLENRWQIYRG